MARINVTAILLLVLILVLIDNSVRMSRISGTSASVNITLALAELKMRAGHAKHSTKFSGDWSTIGGMPDRRQRLEMKLYMNGGNPYRCSFSSLPSPIRIPINAFADKTSSYLMFVHPPGEDGLISETVWQHGKDGAAFDHTIQWAIFAWFKEVEQSVAKEELVIMDVGGNIGLHGTAIRLKEWLMYVALYYAALGHEVHTFEPHPDNYQLLRCSALVNAFPHLAVNEYGLSDAPKSSCMKIEKGNKGHATTHDSLKSGCVPIQMRTMDDYWKKEMGGRRVDFLSVNVEGYELLVLKGGKEMFKSQPPKMMYMEWAPDFLRDNDVCFCRFIANSASCRRRSLSSCWTHTAM